MHDHGLLELCSMFRGLRHAFVGGKIDMLAVVIIKISSALLNVVLCPVVGALPQVVEFTMLAVVVTCMTTVV